MDIYAIERFSQRWIDKAASYHDEDLDDLFDKFFTLFVAYGRLYSAAAELLRSRANRKEVAMFRGDRNEATHVMALFIQQPRFSHLVANRPELANSCATIARLLHQRTFFLHTARGSNNPDWARDHKLSEGLSNLSLKSVLDCLYQIRCNIFHGEKEFAPRQAELLSPAITLLESVVHLSREVLRESQ